MMINDKSFNFIYGFILVLDTVKCSFYRSIVFNALVETKWNSSLVGISLERLALNHGIHLRIAQNIKFSLPHCSPELYKCVCCGVLLVSVVFSQAKVLC